MLRRNRADILVGFGLFALGLIAFLPYVRAGGFLNDDFVEQWWAHFGGFGRAFDILIHGWPRRPLGAVYFASVHTLLGNHQHWQLAWAAGLRILVSVALFGVLRELHIDRFAAGGAAALAMIFPFSDADWLWAAEGQVDLAVALWLFGLWAALRATRRSAHGWTLHTVAVILYAASILLYEITLLATAIGGALYLVRAPRRAALRRWGVDLVVCGAVFLFVTSRQIRLWSGSDQHQTQDLHDTLRHAGLIVDQGLTLMARSVFPFGEPARGVVALCALAIIATAGAIASRTSDHELRHALVRMLSLGAGGILVTGAGWAMVASAKPQDWYLPLATGISNRTNVLAGIGFSLLAVALASLLGLLVSKGASARTRSAGAAVLALIMIGVTGVGYLTHVANDRSTWLRAQRLRGSVLRAARIAFPIPPTNSSIIASGVPLWAGPTVPVFATSVDLMGAVDVMWNDITIAALPAAPASVGCNASGISVAEIGATAPAPYGRTFILDVPTNQAIRISNQAECQAVARAAGVLNEDAS